MNKKLFVLVIALIMVNIVSAQEKKTFKIGNYSLSTITITSGKGAMTSGLDTRFDFSHEKNGILFLVANSDRATVNIGKTFGKFKAVESFGVYKNMLWTGPMLIYTMGPLDVIAWNGLVFAKDKQLNEFGYTPYFFCSYEGASLTFCKNNTIGGAILYFGTDPMNWFLSYKRTISIGERSNLFTEVTYNHDLNLPMFVIGYTMKLK